jgi:biopolymer transport protein ExbB
MTRFRSSLIMVAVLAGVSPAFSAEPVEDAELNAAVARAVLEYGQRVQAATQELAAARKAIANERTPLMGDIREAEGRIAALEAEIAGLQVQHARTQERLQNLRTEQVNLDRNLGYVTNVVLDGFKSYDGNLLPGERTAIGLGPTEIRSRIETSGHPGDALAALDAADLFLARLEQQIGGYTAPGRALREGDNEILEGTFAYLGPEVFFRSRNGDVRGSVREQRDSEFVVTYPMADWDAGTAEALMTGEEALVLTDVSGGRALRLRETRGTLWEEMQKGGIPGYVLMALGVVAIVLTVSKLLDLRKLQVDAPSTMHAATMALARGARTEAEAAMADMRATTRELFATGLRYVDAPRTLLEEQFESFVLRNRLVQERRLQLLAVIATAGPLLGLLGTVTGMIKTFMLIQVFGAGNAGRLSGGISEALVATALGLAVAIPTLVIHGFLSHRIHKGLSLLERYALEFVTAVEESRHGRKQPEPALEA